MMFRHSVLGKLRCVVDTDLFDDENQNEVLYEGVVGTQLLRDFFLRNYDKGTVLDVGCGRGDVFVLPLPITHAVEPNPIRFKQAKKKGKGRIVVRKGWLENIPFGDGRFHTVLCWGTLCHARSIKEALIEVNRVLRIGGVFIFDIVTETILPVVYGVEEQSFVRYAQLYGFSLVERREFVGFDTRVGLAMRKDEEFDYRRLLLPQVKGEINNYLEARDWYMK